MKKFILNSFNINFLQIKKVLCNEEFRSLVNLYLTNLNRKCGLFPSSNYDFIEGHCSSNHAQMLFGWRSAQSQYNNYHVFGIIDPSGHEYRFIEVNSTENLNFSSTPVPTNQLCNYIDNYLFLSMKSLHGDIWVLKHNATGQYVSINSNTNRVILNHKQEAAAEFSIVYV